MKTYRPGHEHDRDQKRADDEAEKEGSLQSLRLVCDGTRHTYEDGPVAPTLEIRAATIDACRARARRAGWLIGRRALAPCCYPAEPEEVSIYGAS
jgi:hypothetical protein